MKRLLKSEVRKDYIEDQFVIIAPKRGKRPHDTIKKNKSPIYHTEKNCVFSQDKQKNIKAKLQYGGKNWSLKVIDNIFPAVTLKNHDAYGVQEVVIETADHNCRLYERKQTKIEELLKAYAERTKALMRVKNIQYILIFKNEGADAGASLNHPHSQIFAIDFIPPQLKEKSKKQHEYLLESGTCIFCDVMRIEQRGPRIIGEDKYMMAFTPYASRFNYEAWIMPKRHRDNITEFSSNEIKSCAKMLKKITSKINALHLPYNFYFHQVIFDPNQHFYIKIKPRGATWAGVELGSDVIINSIPPEEAAEYYRK